VHQKKIKILFPLILVILVLTKVSGFHLYAHSDDRDANKTEHCEVCSILIENQESEVHDFKITTETSSTIVLKEYKQPIPSLVYRITSLYKGNTLFGRPPPPVLV